MTPPSPKEAGAAGPDLAPRFDARSHTTARFSVEETRTQDHLKASFAVDTQAAELIGRFARVAEIEGFPEVARTLRGIAESRAMYAQGHLDFLLRTGEPIGGAVTGDTNANLRASIVLNREDGPELLNEHARTAYAEGFTDIGSWFETIARSRASHTARLEEALAGLLTDHTSDADGRA